MGKSFFLRHVPFAPTEGKRRVLVTGAAGRIGSFFSEHACDRYDLRLMIRGDEDKADEIRAFGDVRQCRLEDLEGLTNLCRGIDTVLHLAADHRIHAPWEELLPHNIIGTYNIFEAARANHCRRIVYASSINAINAFGPDLQVRSDDPVNPANLYGVSKCFGEALCRLYANRDWGSCIALRIGAFQSLESLRNPALKMPPNVVITPRDLHQLIVRCIDDEKLQFAIFHGMSNNRHNRYDISDARELLAYEPEDDAYVLPGELPA